MIRARAISDVGTVVMGVSPAGTSVSDDPGSGLPLLNGPTEFGPVHPTPKQWTSTWTREAEVDDVLFCVRGSTTGRMNRAQTKYAIGRGIAAIRGTTASDTRYLYYAITQGLSRLLSLTSGSVFPNISAGDLRQFEVPWPDEEVRTQVAATLSTLDDKIESNQRIVAVVPSLIRARVLEAINRGSSSVAVADLARFVNGGAYTKAASGGGRMVIRIAELNSGPGTSTVFNDITVPDDRTARAGDILMAWSGSLGVYRWFRDEAIVNQHIFKVLPTGFPAWLVFDRLEAVMSTFRGIAQDKATTMGHIQRGHLTSTRIDVPGAADIAELDAELDPVWARLLVAERECMRLEALRDALLPGLLSGQIRVPAATSAMEGVTA